MAKRKRSNKKATTPAAVDLCIPAEVLDQHLVVLGKTGAGKSSVLRHMVEYLLWMGKRVCVVDPKGDWYGLKLSADGKNAGFPVVLFGDFKNKDARHVAIDKSSGKQVAELIATGNRPCVIGFNGWMPADRTKFWLDFASTLFNCNAGELYLVGDEFHNFAPKGKILDVDAGKALHWSNRILSEGRGIGLVCLIASQRPQKVHNDTLTSCETLVAMRVSHAADRKALKDWVDGCGDDEHGKLVLSSVAGMARGEGFVWSPEIGFGPERIAFPLFTTFDSFAPPQLQKAIAENSWAGIDLDEVREKMADAIAKAEADDPKLLRRRIQQLERDLREKQEWAPEEAMQAAINQAVLKRDEQWCNAMVEPLEEAWRQVVVAMDKAWADVILPPTASCTDPCKNIPQNIPRQSTSRQGIAREVVRDRAVTPHAKRNNSAAVSAGIAQPRSTNVPMSGTTRHSTGADLPKGEAKILAALIQYPDGLDRSQLTIITGYKRSTRDAYIKRLSMKDLVEAHDGTVRATAAGVAALPDAEPLPTGEALQQHWLQTLPVGESAILAALISAWPNALSRDEITDSTGYKRSTRDAYIKRLKAKQVIVDQGGQIIAAETLF